MESQEKAIEQKKKDGEAARWAKLPQRPKDPVGLWKEHWAAEKMDDLVTQDSQENFLLDPYALRLPAGTMLCTVAEGVGAESVTDTIEGSLTSLEAIIDPELLAQEAVWHHTGRFDVNGQV